MIQQPLFSSQGAARPGRRWKKSGAEVFIGPAGWSYDDWEGIVYPQKKPRGFRPPAYLAQWFNTIELNNTFYHPPAAKMSERWVADVSDRPDFLYTAKLWQRFTHERSERSGRAEHWTAADVAIVTSTGPGAASEATAAPSANATKNRGRSHLALLIRRKIRRAIHGRDPSGPVRAFHDGLALEGWQPQRQPLLQARPGGRRDFSPRLYGSLKIMAASGPGNACMRQAAPGDLAGRGPAVKCERPNDQIGHRCRSCVGP